jgi:hypothetical protein
MGDKPHGDSPTLDRHTIYSGNAAHSFAATPGRHAGPGGKHAVSALTAGAQWARSLSEEVCLAVVVLCGAARYSSLQPLLNGGLAAVALGGGRPNLAVGRPHRHRNYAGPVLGAQAGPSLAVIGNLQLPSLHIFSALGTPTPTMCSLSLLFFGAAIAAGWHPLCFSPPRHRQKRWSVLCARLRRHCTIKLHLAGFDSRL